MGEQATSGGPMPKPADEFHRTVGQDWIGELSKGLTDVAVVGSALAFEEPGEHTSGQRA